MRPIALGYLKIGVVLIACAVVFSYVYSRSADFLRGPELTFISPSDGSLLSESLVEVAGTAKHVSHLNLNGRKIFTDEGGTFSEPLLLLYGYNIIKLSAEDRFGRTAEKMITVVYK
jgi:hypothetical protein